VNSVEEAVESVHALDKLDRTYCRAIFEKKFTAWHMAVNYVKLYERLMNEHRHPSTRAPFNGKSTVLKPDTLAYSVRKFYE